MAVIEYLPVATGSTANVVTQANFAGSSYQQEGFVDGLALPEQANKIWRQSSMFASALAFFVSAENGGADVLDDGNQPALTALITSAIVNMIAAAIAGLQIALGFTPVQQGTGVGQFASNVVKIGWSSSGLKATVDVTDLGSFVFEAELDTALENQAAENTSLTNLANAAQAAANNAQGSANTALNEIAALTLSTTRYDVTGQRFLNTTYTNPYGKPMTVSGYAITNGGGNVGSVECFVNGDPDFANTVGATVNNGSCGFSFEVPIGATYEAMANTLTNGQGTAVSSIGRWIETVKNI